MSNHPMPTRGFPTREFETRTSRAQQAMRDVQLDALLVTTEPEIRYFTGFKHSFSKVLPDLGF